MHTLVYFAPTIADGVAFVTNRYGTFAVRLSDGKELWNRGALPFESYASGDTKPPAFGDGLLFIRNRDDDLLALDPTTRQRVWRKDYSRLESSPLVVDDTVYVVVDEGSLVALRTSDGSIRWRFDAPLPISEPTYGNGRIFLPGEEGIVFGLDADSGDMLWKSDTTTVTPRPSGEVAFYPTPVAAFNRVYATRTDGKVLALSQDTGEVDWISNTHAFLTRAPAVAELAGTPPTVYVGSYANHLYALDALTGKPSWRSEVGGSANGPLTLIGHTVYAPIRTAHGSPQQVVGIDVRTHRETARIPEVGAAPVSDGHSLYVASTFRLIRLDPR